MLPLLRPHSPDDLPWSHAAAVSTLVDWSSEPSAASLGLDGLLLNSIADLTIACHCLLSAAHSVAGSCILHTPQNYLCAA